MLMHGARVRALCLVGFLHKCEQARGGGLSFLLVLMHVSPHPGEKEWNG